MNINLQTILAILYANDLERTVALAVKIDSGIADETKHPDIIVTEIRNENIKHLGIEFANGNRYGYHACKVVAYNKYRLDKPYLIQLPDDTTKWANITTESPTVTRPITQP